MFGTLTSCVQGGETKHFEKVMKESLVFHNGFSLLDLYILILVILPDHNWMLICLVSWSLPLRFYIGQYIHPQYNMLCIY